MEIEEFIDTYTDRVAALGHELRAFIKQTVPDSTETLHVGWRVISYGHQKKFCAIAPHGRWINLQFHNGAALDNTEGLLEGSGKSMRHIKIQSSEDLNEQLAALIKQAGEAAV